MAGKQTYFGKLLKKTLQQADQQAKGNRNGLGSILLKGDPGVGKTTFLELVGAVTGVDLITIEVPHIVEEHIINIPFLVYNSVTGQEKTGTTKLEAKQEGDEYSMVLADSNLFTQIQSAQPISDQEYIQYILSDNPTSNMQRIARKMFEQMGGSPDHIPEQINAMRHNFKCILFLDEYFRDTSVRIRNILRDMLNGNIGMHQIPKGTFLMYASNMRDEGLVEIPQNTQFSRAIEFKAPKKDEWFAWLEAKYENDPDVQLQPEVLSMFKKVIDDKDLSVTDTNSQVRSSPRRWEQLVLYVNQSLPADDRADAVALMTNVRNNFINYETGEYSEKIVNKVTKAVAALIKKMSHGSADDVTEHDKTEGQDWDQLLNHHIKQQVKSGKHRKYIPVISGAPGVGKTTQMRAVALDNNLIYLPVDTSKLNPEDVIGLPIPGKRSEDNSQMTVKFTLPNLLEQINSLRKERAKQFFDWVEQQYGPEEAQKRFEKWKGQRYKYLLFFDELNRVGNQKTFNSLRRVILDKNFGPNSEGTGNLKVPDDVVMVGAINPATDTGGTESMTSHFRDVIDVIQAEPSWSRTRSFIMGKPNKGASPEALEAAMFVLDEFAKKFGDKSGNVDKDRAPYYLHVGGEANMYMAPREYDAMFSNLWPEIDDVKDEILADEELSKEDGTEMLFDTIYEGITETLPTWKHQDIAEEEFHQLIYEWVDQLLPKIYSKVISKQVLSQDTWHGVLEKYLTGKRSPTAMPNDSSVNNRMNATSMQQFVDEVSASIHEVLKSKENMSKYILEQDQDEVVLGDDTISTGTEKTSVLNNALKGFLYTLSIHEYQYDRILAIGKSLYRGAKEALKGVTGLSEEERYDIVYALSELRTDLIDALEEIKNEAQ